VSNVRGAEREHRRESGVTVLVVDDQEPFREVAKELVAATDGFRLIGEATSGEEALAAADELCPQLVIMDKRLPGLSGAEATRLIKSRHPTVVVVIVSVEEPHAEVLQSSGAAEFIRKQELSPRVLRRIWRTHGRET
jgi:two-component system, NarL family, invasion response regulator UvrY